MDDFAYIDEFGEWQFADEDPDGFSFDPVASATIDANQAELEGWDQFWSSAADVLLAPVTLGAQAIASLHDATVQTAQATADVAIEAVEATASAVEDATQPMNLAALGFGGVLGVAAVSVAALFLADQILARGAGTAAIVGRLAGSR